jgi:hypothetical protein
VGARYRIPGSSKKLKKNQYLSVPKLGYKVSGTRFQQKQTTTISTCSTCEN